MAVEKLDPTPQITRPMTSQVTLGERPMRSQPRVATTQEAIIVLLGPYLPPQYPPVKRAVFGAVFRMIK